MPQGSVVQIQNANPAVWLHSQLCNHCARSGNLAISMSESLQMWKHGQVNTEDLFQEKDFSCHQKIKHIYKMHSHVSQKFSPLKNRRKCRDSQLLCRNWGKSSSMLEYCFISSMSLSGEGNGNPLQYSCQGDPMDRGDWQVTLYAVARVGHDLETKQ